MADILAKGIKKIEVKIDTTYSSIEIIEFIENHSEIKTNVLACETVERRPHLENRPNEYELTELRRNDNVEEEEEPQVTADEESGVGVSTAIISEPKELKIGEARNLWRVVASCIWCLCAGFNDGAPGVFLPYMEKQYNISYSIVSLIWLGDAIGFILVALLAHKLNVWFGKLKSIPIGTCAMIVMFSLLLTGANFPVIVLGFFSGGIGNGICISHFNVFLSQFENSSVLLGYFHGCYGIGATVSPLIATSFLERGIAWHWFYLILLGLMCFNLVNVFLAFKGVDIDMGYGEDGKDGKDLQVQDKEGTVEQVSFIFEVMRNKTTWINSFWVLFYQGGEVAIGGWFVTYLRDYRKHMNPSVGYVVSGYWLGLTLGRILLTNLCHSYLGARRGNIVMTVLSIVLIMLTWVIPNLVLEGVFVSIAGLFIGPLYPLMITLVSRLVPRKILVVSLTINTAFGSSGGALFPFLIGLISQSAGAFIVLPCFIVIFSFLLILWILLPNVENRKSGDKLNYLNRIW